MRVLYHLTAPPPVIPGTDAVHQEAELLRSRFGGEIVFLLPSSRPWASFPRPLYGLHRLPAIRRLERLVDLHHVYNSELYLFPLLRFLRKPLVYTVVSGFDGDPHLPSIDRLQNMHRIVVQSERDLAILKQRGLTNACVIHPGIDVSRFRHTRLSTQGDFVLLAGSAPWTREQFRSKGVDALLRVAQQIPSLRLIFLWRGLLLRELEKRIDALRLRDRVEVSSDRVDVSAVLARVHAAVVLADWPRLVKAYPHSLLEALACGRPVIVSEQIPMAEYVREAGCGHVVGGVNESELRGAIERLRENYDTLSAKALRVGRKDFLQDDLLAAYESVYTSIARVPE
ncbi:MAG: glycosyltransferase [Vicinamibacteria bacterium]